MKKNPILFAAALILAGCGATDYKVSSQGAPYEIIVVADHNVWGSAAGDGLRSVFNKQYPMISRQETTFDVLRVLPGGFKKLVTKHPNVLITSVVPGAETALEVAQDVYAAPQTVMTLKAPDTAAMAEAVQRHGEDILAIFERAERHRDVAKAKKHTPKEIAELIKSKFGFEMNTTPGYVVRNQAENFLWLSYEMPIASQGIVIYTYPFSGVKDFEKPSLLRRRNEFAANIPGEVKGSFMTTNADYNELVFRQINDRQWAELHGFWDVEGDFMGGPFTNFSTLDVANQRVVCVDFYVYSPDPQLSQRNYIKQLEHFIYTLEI